MVFRSSNLNLSSVGLIWKESAIVCDRPLHSQFPARRRTPHKHLVLMLNCERGGSINSTRSCWVHNCRSASFPAPSQGCNNPLLRDVFNPLLRDVSGFSARRGLSCLCTETISLQARLSLATLSCSRAVSLCAIPSSEQRCRTRCATKGEQGAEQGASRPAPCRPASAAPGTPPSVEVVDRHQAPLLARRVQRPDLAESLGRQASL